MTRPSRWQAVIEEGLPPFGPAAVHLHDGSPTPWRQGLVVRFTPDSGESWVANAKPGYGYRTAVWPWLATQSFIVVAAGNAYLVRPDRPEEWVHLAHQAIGHLFDPNGPRVFIATYTDVLAFDARGASLWNRRVALDGVELATLHDGVLEGRAGVDPPDDWRPFRLRADNGADAAASEQQRG
jgi:hypothetical protein